MKTKSSKISVLLNGILKENPVLVLMLGLCPSLKTTTNVREAVGMGVATTVVLICSNFFISLIKNIVPEKVRIPSYVIVIAGFVSMVELLMQTFDQTYGLYLQLGVYLPLITVNCIILGRAEAFAKKNTVIDSMLDGLGMGLGFILALLAISSVREIFGNGTWFDMGPKVPLFEPIRFFVSSAGGFFVFGIIVALSNKFLTPGKTKRPTDIGCGNCAVGCHQKEEN